VVGAVAEAAAAAGAGAAGVFGRAAGLGPGTALGRADGPGAGFGRADGAGAAAAAPFALLAPLALPLLLGAGGRGPEPGRGPDGRAGLLVSGAEKESRNLRATGASTVEDADFTNSPRSLSLASTSLLVTPSSLASSCTRALPATTLLTERSAAAR
jgi:hypothetical protein